MQEVKAPIIGIDSHRLTTDGEGVTTLVAFHGCPLYCKYCLNPQCLSPDGVLRTITPSELYSEVEIDDLYFVATGGGICFGGGEPLLRSEFIVEFAKIMNPEWSIILETSLNVPLKQLEMIAQDESKQRVEDMGFHRFDKFRYSVKHVCNEQCSNSIGA